MNRKINKLLQPSFRLYFACLILFALLSAAFCWQLALVELGLLPPLICTVLYAFLSIRMEDASILDFLRNAVSFLFLHQQFYEWRERRE